MIGHFMKDDERKHGQIFYLQQVTREARSPGSIQDTLIPDGFDEAMRQAWKLRFS
jgi:hypothetical protein